MCNHQLAINCEWFCSWAVLKSKNVQVKYVYHCCLFRNFDHTRRKKPPYSRWTGSYLLPEVRCPHEGYRMVFASICEHASIVFILRAQAVVKFFLRAASTLKNTDGEHCIPLSTSLNFTLSYRKISKIISECFS